MSRQPVVQIGKSGVQTVTTPDGMTVTSTLQGDPRFGLQAPLVGKEITTTPLGRTRQVLGARAVTLADAAAPMSLSAVTDTLATTGHVGRGQPTLITSTT